MLGLSKDGRVTPSYLPSNFTIKGNVKVPAGFVVTTSAGNLIGPGKSFSAGNATLKDGTPVTNFETFSAWINEGKDTAAGYGIQQISEGEDVSSYTDGFSDEEIAGMKLPETNIPPSFFTQIISNMKLFTNPDNLRKDLETLNFLYYHYSQEIQARLENKEINEGTANKALEGVYHAFSSFIGNVFNRKFIKTKVATELFNGSVQVLKPGKPHEDKAIVFDGKSFYITDKSLTKIKNAPTGPSIPSTSPGGEASKKIGRVDEIITSFRTGLRVFYELDRDLPKEVKDTEEYKRIVENVRIQEAQLAMLGENSTETAKNQAIAEISKNPILLERLLPFIQKYDEKNAVAFARVIEKSKASIDQSRIKVLFMAAEKEIETSADEASKRKAQYRLALLKALRHDDMVDGFISGVSQETGLSTEEVKERLKNVKIKKNGKEHQVFDDKGNFVLSEAMSMESRESLALALAHVFGFSATTDLSKIFSVSDLLASPMLGTRIIGWATRGNEGVLSREQIGLILSGKGDGVKAFSDAMATLSKMLSSETYKVGTNEYTIEQALSIEDDKVRLKTVQSIVEKLKKTKSTSTDEYEIQKATYLQDSLESTLKQDGAGNWYVEKIPPDGSILSEEQIRINKRGMRVCKNFAAGYYTSTSAFSAYDGSHRIFTAQINLLPYFSESQNPHHLISSFGIPFGIRANKDGNLEMNSGVRKELERMYMEANKEGFPKGMTETQKVVTLVEFFDNSDRELVLPASVLAVARLEAISSSGAVNFKIDEGEFPGREAVESGLSAPAEQVREYERLLKRKSGVTAHEIVTTHFNINESDPQYATALKYIQADIDNFKNSGSHGYTGFYIEAYVNLKLALSLGKIESHQVENNVSTLVVRGRDGNTYHVLSKANSLGGFGDSLVITLDKNGTLTTVSFFEQKYGKNAGIPHVDSVVDASSLLMHVSTSGNYQLPNDENNEPYIPVSGVFFSEGNPEGDTLTLSFDAHAGISSSSPFKRTGNVAYGKRQGSVL